MKIKLLAILLFILGVTSATAQNYQTVDDIDMMCSDLGFMGDEEAELAIDKILAQIGLFKNFTIQECPNINNAIAKNIDVGGGQTARFILYDKDFFKRISDKAVNDWAAISILAHEIGHHLNGHSLNDEGSTHKFELEADEFSGFVLARMGATIEDAQSALQTISYERATRTHPAKVDRLNAAARGWNRGAKGTIIVNRASDLGRSDVDPIAGAREVMYRYIEALGGEDAIIGVRSMVLEGEGTVTLKSEGKTTSMDYLSKVEQISPLRKIESFYQSKGASAYQQRLHTPTGIYSRASEKGVWQSTSNVNKESFNLGTSFFTGYSMLVNKVPLELEGKQTMEGVECYVIRNPQAGSWSNSADGYTADTSMEMTTYYGVDKGLPVKDEIIAYTQMRADGSPVVLMNQKHITEMFYNDYKIYDGVKYPNLAKTVVRIFQDGKLLSTTESEFRIEDIQLNVALNKTDFNPNAKK